MPAKPSALSGISRRIDRVVARIVELRAVDRRRRLVVAVAGAVLRRIAIDHQRAFAAVVCDDRVVAAAAMDRGNRRRIRLTCDFLVAVAGVVDRQRFVALAEQDFDDLEAVVGDAAAEVEEIRRRGRCPGSPRGRRPSRSRSARGRGCGSSGRRRRSCGSTAGPMSASVLSVWKTFSVSMPPGSLAGLLFLAARANRSRSAAARARAATDPACRARCRLR